MFVHHKGHSVEKLLWGSVFVHENGTFVEAADGFGAFRGEMLVGAYVCPLIWAFSGEPLPGLCVCPP